MARYTISDIHGCNKTFQLLLEKINFSKEDTLFLLGDYIDRGPDSRGMIDHIFYLQKEGYQVDYLLGNHEEMLLENIKENYHNGESETLESFEVEQSKDIPSLYLDWIKNLKYFIETEGYILVHAGLNFNIENPLEGFHSMLWARHWYKNLDKAWLNGRVVIHGHTPIRDYAIEDSVQYLNDLPVIDIDAGCAFRGSGYGQLCALNLDNKELTFQRNVDGFK